MSETTTILIVDDSRVARISLKRMVAEILPTAAVLEAGCTDEALAVLAENTATLALIDFNMPGRDGLQLAEQLREERPEMRLSIVTANVQDSLAERARSKGIAFIPKPPDRAALAAFLTGGGAA